MNSNLDHCETCCVLCPSKIVIGFFIFFMINIFNAYGQDVDITANTEPGFESAQLLNGNTEYLVLGAALMLIITIILILKK